jgi:hypothetical protein
MQTLTILAIVAIVAAVGMSGSVTGILLSQQAHAESCQTFIDSSGITKKNCSNSHGKNPATNLNEHFGNK